MIAIAAFSELDHDIPEAGRLHHVGRRTTAGIVNDHASRTRYAATVCEGDVAGAPIKVDGVPEQRIRIQGVGDVIMLRHLSYGLRVRFLTNSRPERAAC